MTVLTLSHLTPSPSPQQTLEVNTNDFSLDPVDLLLNLTLIILIPLLVGKALRFKPSIKALAAKYKKQTKIGTTLALITIPWMKVSSSAEKLRDISPLDLLYIVLIGGGMHMCFVAINYIVCRYILRMEKFNWIAVVVMASQKTLGVAVTVLDFLPAAAGEQGLILVPIIISHFVQIMIDSVIVSKLRIEDEDEDTILQKDVPGPQNSIELGGVTEASSPNEDNMSVSEQE
jgi:solute carrier family 10 (sodium/bile acid cotransporter), member 7